MIVEKVLEAKEKKIKSWPVKSNRASDLGHECIRYLVFNRTRWEEKTLHDVRLQMIFDLGNLFEEAVMGDLREAGIQMVEQQRPFSWPEYNITGHIDCKLVIDGVLYPTEIKSAAPHAFTTVDNITDMIRHKYHYMRKYPAQLTLYMLMSGTDIGVFLFKNKSTGELKEIWYGLDYDFAESLIQKAEAINKHVADGTVPDPIDYSEDVCGSCSFPHICMPDRIGSEVEIVDDSELVDLINKYYELKPFSKEYDDVDKRISEIVKGREKILAGDYFIQGKWIDKKSYNVPAEVKQQYETVSQYWKKTIAPVK